LDKIFSSFCIGKWQNPFLMVIYLNIFLLM
jgi:hypothetical protein